MGFQQSSLFYHPRSPPNNQFGSIVLELKTPTVTLPDQEIKGFVHFNMTTQMPAINLSLQLIGQQRTQWSESRGSGKHRRTVWFSGDHQIVRTNQIAYNFPNSIIPAGLSTVEFTFRVPSHIVYSATCTILNRYVNYAIINYNFIANVQGPNPLSFTRTLQVREDIGPTLTGMLITEKQRVDNCCSCNQGTLGIQCSTDKISYYSHEKPVLTVEINATQMKQTVQNVNVTLAANLHVSGRGSQRNFYLPCYTWTLGSVEKGVTQKRTKEIDLLYGVHNSQGQMPEQMTPEGQDFALQVQGTSTSGDVVRLEYFLDINPVCGGCQLSGSVGPGARVFIRIIKGSPAVQAILAGVPAGLPDIQPLQYQAQQPQQIQYGQVAQVQPMS